MDYDIPKNVEQCREKVKELFLKNQHVTDIRVIDLLVVKVKNSNFVSINYLIYYS